MNLSNFRRSPFLIKAVLILGIAVLTVNCEEEEIDEVQAVDAKGTNGKPPKEPKDPTTNNSDKILICHFNSKNGTYSLKEINEGQLPGHLAHGDVRLDDPNGDGFVPDNECGYEGTGGEGTVDADGDGVSSDLDCDDTNAEIGGKTMFYADADGDGFGNPEISEEACDAPEGYVDNPDDCDDTEIEIYPGRTEIPNNGIDDDCDPNTVDDVNAQKDSDNDGFTADVDCNDEDPNVNPGVSEIPYNGIDDDCKLETPDDDLDGDGFVKADDCNDDDASINPGATEICADGIDNNCNGNADEGSLTTYYQDNDKDGFGNPSVSKEECVQPEGFVIDNTDCNDNNASIGSKTNDNDCDGVPTADDCNDNDPNVGLGSVEVCDGLDNDCDGQTDEGLLTTFYRDQDGDGFGDISQTRKSCSAPGGYVAISGDCDDSDAAVNPDAAEVPGNGKDDDCDASTPDTPEVIDTDKDTVPDADDKCPNTPTGEKVDANGCSASQTDTDGDGYNSTVDCNDNNPDIYPSAIEICDGVDNNCDDRIDEGYASRNWYPDNDGDGWGQKTATALSQPCDPSTSNLKYVYNNGDCNDNDPNIRPGKAEICDGIDNNCNGYIDEGGTKYTYYLDNDGDGYGLTSNSIITGCPPENYVRTGGDCDDDRADVNPDSPEICDNIDNNCNNSIDEGLTTKTYYRDNDGDGYGVSNSYLNKTECSQPEGYVDIAGDCDDFDPSVNPGATETCNGVDSNCNLIIDDVAGTKFAWYRDSDLDGFGNGKLGPIYNKVCDPSIPGQKFVINGDDCNDFDASINPDALEIPGNGIDDDCNPSTPDVIDNDGDGFDSNVDCVDNDATIFPGAPEICDGKDNDCDGEVDEGLQLGEYYVDSDNDGFGDELSIPIKKCLRPGGYEGYALINSANRADCDDDDPKINPGAEDPCDDGIDQDCNDYDPSCTPGNPPLLVR